MNWIKQKVPGIALCVLIAAVAGILGSLQIGSFSLEVIGAPVFAILIGMLLTGLMPSLAARPVLKGGIQFSGKKILQWAVVLLGFSLNLTTIAQVGLKSLPVILTTIIAALLTAWILYKLLRMDRKVSCLIGVGSAICGGSAIAATAPVIDADEEEIAHSISVIFLFNVMAALIFPFFGYAIGFGSEGFAIFAGTAVNDTSSVTAVASTAEGLYGVDGILSAAVTTKLTRTLAIIPITLILAFYRAYRAKKEKTVQGNNFSLVKIFPWFLLYFIGAALITTLVGLLPESAVTAWYDTGALPAIKWLAKFCIAVAMAAIGLNTNVLHLIRNGIKPIFMGFCCWVSVTGVSIGMQLLTGIYYTNLA